MRQGHSSGKKKKKFHKEFSKKTNSPDNAVRAKKHLGQHFLKDEEIAKKIANTLTHVDYKNVIEIGPGMGVLTKYILLHDLHLVAMDLDTESIAYLQSSFPLEHPKVLQSKSKFEILEADFLKFDLDTLFTNEQFAITGNFPYNISTQIVFKMLEHRDRIPEFTGMFQKEVAQRICEPEGSKAYGILSVLTQAFYKAEYLFTVAPEVFDPPPKVESGVLRLRRKEKTELDCDVKMLYKVVKTAFGQRRKTLRNSLKSFNLEENIRSQELFSLRPEQLSVAQFISLTKMLESLEDSE